MSKVYKHLISAGILSVLVFAAGYSQDATKGSTQSEKEEAQRAWDQVIAAKGGRERLGELRSLLITFSHDRKNIRGSALYVFPNKYWDWVVDRPRPKDTDPMPSMTLCNGDIKRRYSISIDVVFLREGDDCKYDVEENDFLLLETQSRPFLPVRVSGSTFKKQPIDIIETRFHSHRIDFTVDAKSFMVLKVSDYGYFFFGPELPDPLEYVFKDYVDVNGVKMPLAKGWLEYGKKNSKVEFWVYYTYQTDVDYDPKFFEGPPTLLPSVDAWRPDAAKLGKQKVWDEGLWMRCRGLPPCS